MPISLSEYKHAAKGRMRAAKPSAFLVTAVYLLFTYLISALVYRLTGYTDYANSVYAMYTDVLTNHVEPYAVNFPAVNALGLVLAGALLVMSLMMEFGYEGYCLSVSRGVQAGVRDLFNGFNRFGKVLGLMLLRTLIISAWTLLLVVPGIIAFYRYRTAVFVMLDNPDMGVLECLAETSRQTQGHKMEYFLLDLSFLGWWIASYLVSYLFYVPLLDIWLSPYVWTTRALFYDGLNGRIPQHTDTEEENTVR